MASGINNEYIEKKRKTRDAKRESFEEYVVGLEARIAELEAAQRWHVVADGELPEVGEEVFVCDESGHRRVDWLVCKQIDGVGETLFYSAAYDDDPPTHWMPLPKLPEVQE